MFFFSLGYNLTERKILYSYKLSYFIKQRVMDLTIVIPCGYYNSYLLKNLLEPIMDYILVYHWHTLTAASKSSWNEQSSTASLSPSISLGIAFQTVGHTQQEQLLILNDWVLRYIYKVF